ncbi:MAG: hypothetical protein KGM24_02505, partial [Elusimicrobia bacterium]|nr:hypothetical protein [Elusimicrobiota bacterium]
MTRRRAVPWALLAAAAAGALFFARMRVRVDPDLFFHLADGRGVFAGRLPLAEAYSYTRAGRPMVATEWLSSASFYAAFRAGGYPAVALLASLLLAGALGLAAAAIGAETSEETRALLVALAAFALLPFALAKVQNYTFLLFALDLYWIRLWERGRRWVPWAMAGLLALWVNLHGGFMLGWVLLGGVCALELGRTRRAAALLPWAAGTFACFLHPNGALAFVYPIWFVFAPPAGRSLIVEWRPAALALPLLPDALILALALALRADRLRSRFPWALPALVFLVMGLRARKMLPFFALSAAVAAGRAAAGVARSRPRGRLALA